MRLPNIELVPPRRSRPVPQLLLTQLWRALPVEDRQQLLRTLGRVVAQQLASTPGMREVANERP